MTDFDPSEFTFPGIHLPDMSSLIPEPIDLPSNHMWADEQFAILKKYIIEFENSLDPEHEVGICFTHFGHAVLMQVTEIRCEEPVLLVFRGIVNEKEATLIQHINQLNFLLTSVPKEPDRPKRRIGFSSETE